MKVMTIVGARPQFIKAAVVSRSINKYNDKKSKAALISEVIVHTGQHYDENMSDIFFRQMHIPYPNYNLGISGLNHGSMTGQMLISLEQVALNEKPDLILVYGDTNSTLAGALTAIKLGIPLAHVEAGLRSFNMKMPEEINRILTDRISSYLFCPTENAENNLKNEGYTYINTTTGNSFAKVYNIGDVMYDAAMFYRNIAKPTHAVTELLNKTKGKYYLATIHRAENTDEFANLSKIISALEHISKKIPIILPIHPRTRKKLMEFNIKTVNIECIDPVGYFDMISLIENSNGVFTDSGGLQKEAYFFSKPCITLRDETEWIELVQCGGNVLVGANYEKIITAETNLKIIEKNQDNIYGTGDAADKIVSILIKEFNIE